MKAQSTLHKYESPVKITQVYNLAKLRKRKNNYTIQPTYSTIQGGGEDTMSSKYQKLDADPKAIQQINFTGNLTRAGGARMYFIIEEAKETVLESSKGIVKVL